MAQGRAEIGTGTYCGATIAIYDARATLRIGAWTSIAADVTILLGGEHSADHLTNFPFDRLHGVGHRQAREPVSTIIGSDVWIGRGATILSGVLLGDGCVVAAGAVVSSDVPPMSVVGGVPAKHIRERFDQETKEALLQLRWWSWPAIEVLEVSQFLISGDLDALRHYAGGRAEASSAVE